MTEAERHIQSRTIVLELMVRALLTWHVMNVKDPLGVIDNFTANFEKTLPLIDLSGVDEAEAEAMRRSMLAIFKTNTDAVVARIFQRAEEQSAAAGGARN